MSNFLMLFALLLYVETVNQDCIGAVQQETEFSYLADFIDSSLLVIKELEKGFTLNYVNDTFLKQFEEYLRNMTLGENSSDDEDEANECVCYYGCTKKDDDDQKSSTRAEKLHRLLSKKIFQEFNMDLEQEKRDHCIQGMDPWELTSTERKKFYKGERSYTLRQILAMNNASLSKRIFTLRRQSNVHFDIDWDGHNKFM